MAPDAQGPCLVLIDDDPTFAKIMKSAAEAQGLELQAFASLVEVGGVASLNKFDVVVLDFGLEHLTGVEIAAYLDSLLPGLPAVLISANAEKIQPFAEGKPDANGNKAPLSVREVVAKADGPEAILAAAVRLFQGSTRRRTPTRDRNRDAEF